MWKDFLYFNKGQRIGIVILLCLILVALFVFGFFYFSSVDKPVAGTEYLEEARRFEQNLIEADSIKKLEWHKKYERADSVENNRKYAHVTKIQLVNFDPNSIDSVGLVGLGLKPYVASNILKYRRKGGVFRTKESFSKVFGITKEKFTELEPFIVINSTQIKSSKIDSAIKVRKEQKIENLIVEINAADTTELMKVKGVGRGYARGIVRFRQQTGGFARIEQLREMYGMTDQNYEKIKSSFTVNLNLIKKINVNTASVERLNAHPYLNFYESKAIYEYRRRKGKLSKIDELNNIDGLSSETISKIAPYLDF